MKVCVLQPSYEGSAVEHRQYDPARSLGALLPESRVDHVFLRKATVFRQLRELRREGYDIFVNLCEGYLDWDIPSIDVISSLERLELAYTGPTAALYDPPKSLMKMVAWYAGVAVPNSVLARSDEDALRAAKTLRFPLFVKPNHGGDSLGIESDSLCADAEQLLHATRRTIGEFDEAIIDDYIDGREFSVLVCSGVEAGAEPFALRPVEFVFPPGSRFKTYLLKAAHYLPDNNLPVRDADLDARLRSAATAVFRNFAGVGYCRIDFRMGIDGIPRVIDVNFACSVLYSEGSYGTADYILLCDGIGQSGFLRHIIAEGIARHRRKTKAYEVSGSALSGYGIRARFPLRAGAVVFRGEERAQRMATRRHVQTNWSTQEIETFRRYAYPVSEQVRILWDERPEDWAPQNHSCDPNTGYRGLDVIALRDIAPGEELTLDYETFCNEDMAPFDCNCGSSCCRGRVTGKHGNSVDMREREAEAPGDSHGAPGDSRSAPGDSRSAPGA